MTADIQDNDDFESQITYFKTHPSKCIADFLVQPGWLNNIQYDGHGFAGIYPNGLIRKHDIVFSIKCKCGCNFHRLLAEFDEYEIWFDENKIKVADDKYFLKCVSCQSRHLFFDPSLHGYNAETTLLENINDAFEKIGVRKKEKTKYECKNCKKTSFEVFARFEYSTDLFSEPLFEGREQEFFSWLTVVGRCKNCSTINTLINYECA